MKRLELLHLHNYFCLLYSALLQCVITSPELTLLD